MRLVQLLTQIKLKLRRKNSLSNFTGHLHDVKGLSEINDIIDGACAVKSLSDRKGNLTTTE